MNGGENEVQGGAQQPEPLYASFVAVRNTELTAYWSRNNILSAINLGLLAVAFAGRKDSFAILHSVLVGVIGIGLSIVWLLFIHLGKELLTERWERQIRTYETTIQELNHRLFTNTRVEEERNPLAGWNNLNILTIFLPTICIAAWIAFIVINGCA